MDTLTFSDNPSFDFSAAEQLLRKVPGIMVTNATGFEEVVVVGFATVRKELSASFAVAQIQEIHRPREDQRADVGVQAGQLDGAGP